MNHVPGVGGLARGLAVIVALGFMLAACDRVSASKPTVATDPTSFATTWSTPASQPTATTATPTTTRTSSITIPARAQENSARGAMEFVEFLVSEVNRVYAEVDPDSLGAYFTTDCIGCKDLLDHAKETAREELRTNEDIWFIETQQCMNLTTRAAEVAVFIQQIDAGLVDDRGVVARTIGDTREGFYLVLSRESGSWIVSEWLKIEE